MFCDDERQRRQQRAIGWVGKRNIMAHYVRVRITSFFDLVSCMSIIRPFFSLMVVSITLLSSVRRRYV